MENIKILKHCENMLKVINEINKYVKVQLLNCINYIEQFSIMGTAIR